MKLGACVPLEQYGTLVDCGYRSIALAAKDVAAWSEAELAHARQILTQGPLERISLNSFCPASLRLHGPGYSREAVMRFTWAVLERGSKLGFRYLGIGAPASRNLLPGEDPAQAMDEFRQAIGDICTLAAQYGMEILMESVCSVECNFITTTRQALAFVREMGRENLHLVYDIYHEYMERQPLSVIEEAASEIRVVHAAQDAGKKRAYLCPAQAAVFRPYWDALQKAGYAGEWNVEAFEGDCADGLRQTMRTMQLLAQDAAE